MKRTKRNIAWVAGIALLLCTACHDLDLNPLSQGSTENWYSNETELRMAVNNLYQHTFWPQDEGGNSTSTTDWSGDMVYRETLNDFLKGTLTGQNTTVIERWKNMYKVVARTNSIIDKAYRAIEAGTPTSTVDQIVAEAHFFRGYAYGELASKFGDVPLVVEDIEIEEGFAMGRTPVATVKEFVYNEFDLAATSLPLTYSGEQRATKGAALALKARYALYMGDYAVAAAAAKEVIDSEIYTLHSNYYNLFLQGTKNSKESIFVLPRSIELNVYSSCQYWLPRNHGGYGGLPNPTWDLFAAYPCTDGLPIDESPLFDPHDPFKNRDPRLGMTIVPFGENFLGIEYNPHPQALTVMNYKTGQMIKNNDTRAVAQYASYNGLTWKKGIDESCLENSMKWEADRIIIRLADVLLMYAEAKIELNQIDQSVLDAINRVRARAYEVDYKDTSAYPAVVEVNQDKLRTIVRTERRIELPREGLHYMDLIRWKLMAQEMSKKVYIMLYPSSKLIEEVVDKGDWFWAFTPDIDENGMADFSKLEAAGKIMPIAEKSWNERQYLWPIPTTEILINPNMTQNPGY